MVRTVKTTGENSCPERCSKTLSFGRSSELCNVGYYKRRVIFSVLSNNCHWGKNRSAFYEHYQRYEGGLNRPGAFFVAV